MKKSKHFKNGFELGLQLSFENFLEVLYLEVNGLKDLNLGQALWFWWRGYKQILNRSKEKGWVEVDTKKDEMDFINGILEGVLAGKDKKYFQRFFNYLSSDKLAKNGISFDSGLMVFRKYWKNINSFNEFRVLVLLEDRRENNS